METSDMEDSQQTRTPPRKLRHYGAANEKKARHQRSLIKFVTKAVEEIEYRMFSSVICVCSFYYYHDKFCYQT